MDDCLCLDPGSSFANAPPEDQITCEIQVGLIPAFSPFTLGYLEPLPRSLLAHTSITPVSILVQNFVIGYTKIKCCLREVLFAPPILRNRALLLPHFIDLR